MTSPDELRERVKAALVEDRRDYDHNDNLIINEDAAADAVLAVVTPELERRDAEIAALKEKRVGDEQAIRALMAGKEEIAAELGWSEAPASGLMAARCGRLRIEREEAQQQVRMLAWLHAEAVWQREDLRRKARIMAASSERFFRANLAKTQEVERLQAQYNQAVEDWGRNDEQMLAENQRLADENELLREELDKVSGGWEARVASRTALRAERDALRAQLAEAREALERVGCQFDMCTGPVSPPVDMRTCYVCELLARLPVSESVPATPEPTRDRPSMVAHPELDFPDCLTEFHRGVVFGWNRAIEEFEDRCRDLDRSDAAPYWDVVRWLEGKVRSYRDQAARVQAPSSVDLSEVEAAPPTFGCLRIDLVPEWKKGDKALYRAHPDDEGEEVEVRAVAGSTTLVEADPFPFGNPQHWSADVSELSPLPAPAPRCPEIVPDGHESAMECGADSVPGAERCADHTYPSRDSATSEASTPGRSYDVLDEEPFGSHDDCTDPFEDPDCTEADCPKHNFGRVGSASSPPAAGEADTTPRVWKDCDGDTWREVEPGSLALVANREGMTFDVDRSQLAPIERVWQIVGPLVEVLPNTEQEAEK